MDILITDGKYPDFEAGNFGKSNIGIKDGKITYIGNEMPRADTIIDAAGLIVSPGFIDIHMHEEDLAANDYEYSTANYMVKMGVTLAVGGNCGLPAQPLKKFKEFIASKGGCPTNYMMYTGYNAIRTKFQPDHYGQTTRRQRTEIHKLMQEEYDEGAMGLSFGIEYDPGITFEEMIEAIKINPDPNLLVAAHYRSDFPGNIDSIMEMIRIQKETDKPFQISHLSSASAYGDMKYALEAINEYMKKNPKLNFDTYPYNAFMCNMGDTVFDKDCFEKWGKTYSDLIIAQEPYKNMRCNKEIFEDCRKNYPDILVIGQVMQESDIALAIADKNGMIASDGEAEHNDGHPRVAGTFPRVLGKYVREYGVISLYDALRKMTIEPAKRLGKDDEMGQIKEGYIANLTIFNPETIRDGADFGDIDKPNTGIDYVIVNGGIAVKDGRIINDHLGRFIPYRRKQEET